MRSMRRSRTHVSHHVECAAECGALLARPKAARRMLVERGETAHKKHACRLANVGERERARSSGGVCAHSKKMAVMYGCALSACRKTFIRVPAGSGFPGDSHACVTDPMLRSPCCKSATASAGLSSGEGDAPSRSSSSSCCRYGSLKPSGCASNHSERSRRMIAFPRTLARPSSKAESAR